MANTAVILYDKMLYANDATIVQHLLRKAGITMIGHIDLREPHVVSDIQVHVGVPVYSAVSWSHHNILVIRTSDWKPAYDAYLDAFTVYHMTDDWPTEIVGVTSEIYNTFIPLLAIQGKKDRGLGTPVLQIADCPPISIVTPTYHRRALIDIAFHNMLSTDYPQDKIEWIIVEDSEEKEDMATDKIINFQVLGKDISVKYIPLEGRLTIGAKRNIGVTHATHSIVLFMDDDDHYPVTSFRRRVAWLLHGKKDIVCCTTLPLYDLKRGTSAISIPPFHLPLSQRISEATLTFRKSAWESRPFAEVSVAEGETWIDGREQAVLEIPPQQIIVAFTHGTNQSSRSVPSDAPVSCFWGFPKEYLQFIHGLANVSVS
jgi:hypothetical protein